MNKIFNLDNPVMVFLTRVADLIILNVLAIVCSLPIITIGASWTAMHYVTIRMVRKEEGYIARDFFKSFKENFKQATVIWLIAMVALFVIVGDYFIFFSDPASIPKWIMVVIVILTYLALSTIVFVFPLLARYKNTTGKMILNAFLLSVANVPHAVTHIVFFALPIVLLIFKPQFLALIAMIGYSGLAYIGSIFWNQIFKKMEPEAEASSDEEEMNETDEVLVEEIETSAEEAVE